MLWSNVMLWSILSDSDCRTC